MADWGWLIGGVGLVVACILSSSIVTWMIAMPSDIVWIRASIRMRSVGSSICGTLSSVFFMLSCWDVH